MSEVSREEVVGEGAPFQPGDLVECILSDSLVQSPCEGEQFIVKWCYLSMGEVYVGFQPDSRLTQYREDGWYAHRFRLVKSFPKPEITSGGPYVCTSVYENVVKQRDVALEAVAAHQKEIKSLQGDSAILKKIIADLKMERRQEAEELTQLREHVRTIIQQAAKEVETLKKQISDTERPPLPQPLPPVWLRSKWWYAMNEDGVWYAYMNKPYTNPIGNQWHSINTFYQRIESVFMSNVNIPPERWAEACWQVT